MAVRLLRPLSCCYCKRNFQSFDRFQVHKARHMTKFVRHKFVPTQERFGSLHIKRHNHDSFLQRRLSRNNLILPIIPPANKKSYQCEYCYKVFFQNDSLKRHIRAHTKDKLFQCEYCQQRFRRNYLKMHIRTHTKEQNSHSKQYPEETYQNSY